MSGLGDPLHNYIIMKKTFIVLLFCSITTTLIAQQENPVYNKQLADSLGADDYGMKRYVFVILKSGTNKTDNKTVLDSLFRGHMANINRLAETGKLVVAGPLGKNDKSYRGIFILNAKTLDEANALLMTDPAIKEHLFDVEIIEWYGSAALPIYLKMHQRIEKKKP